MKKDKPQKPKHAETLKHYIEERDLTRVEQIRGTVLIFIFLFAFFTMPLTLMKESMLPYVCLVLIVIIHYGIIYPRLQNLVIKNKFLRASFKHSQSIINLILITVLVHLTGGIESYFVFAYVFEIIMSGFLLSWRESFWEASMGWIFYFLMLYMEKINLIEHISIWPDALLLYQSTPVIISYTLKLMGVLYISSFIAGYINVYILKNIKKMNQMMEYLSKLTISFNKAIINDAATGLYNFNYFKLRIVEEILKAKFFKAQFALIYFGINDFDAICEKIGFYAGNNFLKSVGAKLNYLFKKHDLACRVSDGEFMAFLNDIKPAEVLVKLKQIKEELENIVPQIKESRGFEFVFSFGWIMYPEDAQGVEVLLEKARQSLYIARYIKEEPIFRYKGEFEKN